MHYSAYENARKFYELYCKEGIESKRILDVGSYDVNGTMKPIFEKGLYTGLDQEEGPNVDVIASANEIPFSNDQFDVVLSSSCFEHDDFFWLTFLEMCRVVKPGGYLYVQAPSNGPYHAHPVDNWRFYIDGWVALRKWAARNGYDLELVSHYIDTETEPPPYEPKIWHDSVAIYQKVRPTKMVVNDASVEKGHHRVKYRNVPMVKCPFDYVSYQMIVNEIRPDLIIEIGTLHGGNSLYLADLLEAIGNGVVHTIDIDDLVTNDLVNFHPRIRRFYEGYENYDMRNAESFQKVLIIDDGSHKYSDVLACLKKFSSLVSVGSYFIVEDGVLCDLGLDNSEYAGGPVRAIKEFLSESTDFVIDWKWIDMFGENSTFNKNGFLLRVK